jgi:callose synthase
MMQLLAIIAFHHGKMDIDTIKILLSAGPAFFVLNFIECMFSIFLLL